MSLTSTDLSLSEHANSFAAHHDGWEDAARVCASWSEPVFLAGVVLLIVAGVLLRRARLAVAGVLAGIAAAIALALGSVIASIVDRSRPFVDHPRIHAFVHHAADAGFPSDHATAAFAIAVVLVVRLGWWGVPVLIAAALLSVSRVLLGIHYPGDVLAGAVLGSAVAWVVCLVASRPRVISKVDALASRGGGSFALRG